MSTKQPTALALTAGWTDAPVTLTNSGNQAVFSNTNCSNSLDAGSLTISNNLSGACNNYVSGWWYGDYWYPYYRPVWTTVHRPIRLTMAEVERLRVAAKKDKALRETLEKFTDHIEVIVDFGKAT